MGGGERRIEGREREWMERGAGEGGRERESENVMGAERMRFGGGGWGRIGCIRVKNSIPVRNHSCK